jgi:hypothetical protein
VLTPPAPGAGRFGGAAPFTGRGDSTPDVPERQPLTCGPSHGSAAARQPHRQCPVASGALSVAAAVSETWEADGAVQDRSASAGVSRSRLSHRRVPSRGDRCSRGKRREWQPHLLRRLGKRIRAGGPPADGRPCRRSDRQVPRERRFERRRPSCKEAPVGPAAAAVVPSRHPADLTVRGVD